MKKLTLSMLVLATAAVARGREDVAQEALDYAKEAAELNDDESSRCQKKLGAKLEALVDALKDARDEQDRKSFAAAESRARAARRLLDDDCPKRVRGLLSRKLDRVLDVLADAQGASERSQSEPEPPGASGGSGIHLSLDGLGALVGSLAGQGSAQSRSYHRTSSSEQLRVNGREVPLDEEAPAAAPAPRGAELSGYCKKNPDCSSNICFVGAGHQQGYCSKMCENFSDCPTFWDCRRAGNAPQKICMQRAD